MVETELDRKIMEDCEAVVQGMGCRIVEARTLRGKKGVQVFIVIFRAEGVSLELCCDVLKTLRPRIQMLTNDPGAHIEVSSPGLERLIKDSREYRIFCGRGLRLLAAGETEWRTGILADVADTTLTLKSGDASQTFAFSDIRKAKLDHTQEGV
jgi:ribosome maturation factor RimP